MEILRKIQKKYNVDVVKTLNSEIVLPYTTLKLFRATIVVVLGLVLMAMGRKILQEVEVTSIVDVYVSLLYFSCSFFYLLYSTIALGIAVIFFKAFISDQKHQVHMEGSKIDKVILTCTFLSLSFMYTILSNCVIVGTKYWF